MAAGAPRGDGRPTDRAQRHPPSSGRVSFCVLEMRVQRHSGVRAFLNRAEPFLMRNEAENNMMLAVRGTAGSRGVELDENAYLATIEDSGEVVGCAVRTPPFGLVITKAGIAA